MKDSCTQLMPISCRVENVLLENTALWIRFLVLEFYICTHAGDDLFRLAIGYLGDGYLFNV